MAWIKTADYTFEGDGRLTLKWPDGAVQPSVITITDSRPYVTLSVRGVSFYADATQDGFEVEVPDAPQPPAEEPEHPIVDEEDPPPPVDSPFAHPVPQPQQPPPAQPEPQAPPAQPSEADALPGEPVQPGEAVVDLQKT